MLPKRRSVFGPAVAIGSLIAAGSLVVLVVTGIANVKAMDPTSLARDAGPPAIGRAG